MAFFGLFLLSCGKLWPTSVGLCWACPGGCLIPKFGFCSVFTACATFVFWAFFGCLFVGSKSGLLGLYGPVFGAFGSGRTWFLAVLARWLDFWGFGVLFGAVWGRALFCAFGYFVVWFLACVFRYFFGLLSNQLAEHVFGFCPMACVFAFLCSGWWLSCWSRYLRFCLLSAPAGSYTIVALFAVRPASALALRTVSWCASGLGASVRVAVRPGSACRALAALPRFRACGWNWREPKAEQMLKGFIRRCPL